MVIHSSTTIRHSRNFHGSFAKENRLVFGVTWEKVKMFGSGVAEKAGTGWSVLKAITLPTRIALFPALWASKQLYDKAEKGVELGKYPAYTAKYGAIGLGKETFYGTGKELLKGPYNFFDYTLVKQFKTVTKGVFTLPLEILRAPGRFLKGLKESVGHTRRGVKEVLGHTLNLSPLKAIKSARSAIWQALKTPFMEPLKPIAMPFYEVGENIVKGKLAYYEALNGAQKQFRHGIRETLNSWDYAKAQIATERAEKEAKKAEKEAKLKALEEANKAGQNKDGKDGAKVISLQDHKDKKAGDAKKDGADKPHAKAA